MNAQGVCTMCDAGYGRAGYHADGHAICVACMLGWSYSTADMLSCDLLPTCAVGKGVVPGTVFSTTSVTTSYCEDCSSDEEYSDEDSLSSCQTHSACPAGEGVVNALNQVSDTSHRDCESCPNDKYSARSTFAQCYTFAAAKYTKTGPATFPLACAANHYRVDANEIEYDSSTGAMSNDVCTSCGTCTVPTKTACDATSPTVCCTTKPPLSAYSASAGAIPDPTCAFTCDDPNAEVGPNADSCECETGWERGSDSVLCTETPVESWTMHPSQGCQDVNRHTESGITLESAKEMCRDYVKGGLYQGNVIAQESCVSVEQMPTGEFLFSAWCIPAPSSASSTEEYTVAMTSGISYWDYEITWRIDDGATQQFGSATVDLEPGTHTLHLMDSAHDGWHGATWYLKDSDQQQVAGAYQLSWGSYDSVDFTLISDYAISTDNHNLYVIDRSSVPTTSPIDASVWTVYSEKACAGRNELGDQSGITIVDAQAWCQDNAACVSFERMPTAGKFQFSTSCDPSTYAAYSNHDLYVIDRK